jgi:acyl carrier protein
MTDTATDLRRLIAGIVGLPAETVLDLPPETPLLTGELGLSSRGGARLLLAVRERFGVDVAAEDLALRSLATLATLTAFVDAHRPRS